MLTLWSSRYSKHELFVLRNVILDAKYAIEDSWAECNTYGEKCCSVCNLRTVCGDLRRLADYIKTVENSVETVEKQKP